MRIFSVDIPLPCYQEKERQGTNLVLVLLPIAVEV